MSKAIIFDLGKVVFVYNAKTPTKILISKLLDIDKEILDEPFNQLWDLWARGRINEEEFWSKLLEKLDKKAPIEDLKQILYNSFKLDSKIYNFIKKLKENYEVYFFTNNTKEWLDYICNKYNFYEENIIASFNYGLLKPEKEFYQKLLEIIKVEPSQCIFVDDKENNIFIAEEFGMKGVVYKNLGDLKGALSKLFS